MERRSGALAFLREAFHVHDLLNQFLLSSTLDRRIQNVGQLVALFSQGVKLAVQTVLVLALFDARLEGRDSVSGLCSVCNFHSDLITRVFLFEFLQLFVSLYEVVVLSPATALFWRFRIRFLSCFFIRSSRFDVIRLRHHGLVLPSGGRA